MKKILVTGGLGFIGSTVIKMIISNTEDKILNIDKNSYASMPEALQSIQDDPRYVFQKVNISDLNKMITL